MSEKVMICGNSDNPHELRRAIEEARQNGTEVRVIVDEDDREMLAEIERHEQRRSGFNTIAMMAQMFGSVYGIGNRPRSKPHFFEYSGIPTEEQKRKSAERKARKKARKRNR